MEKSLFKRRLEKQHPQQQQAQLRVIGLGSSSAERVMLKQHSPRESLQALAMHQARNQLGGRL